MSKLFDTGKKIVDETKKTLLVNLKRERKKSKMMQTIPLVALEKKLSQRCCYEKSIVKRAKKMVTTTTTMSQNMTFVSWDKYANQNHFIFFFAWSSVTGKQQQQCRATSRKICPVHEFK